MAYSEKSQKPEEVFNTSRKGQSRRRVMMDESTNRKVPEEMISWEESLVVAEVY